MAKPAPDPFVKRKLEQNTSNKRLKTDAEDPNYSPMDKIKLITTPLWNMPYPDQVRDFIFVCTIVGKSINLYYIFLVGMQAERDEIYPNKNWPENACRK